MRKALLILGIVLVILGLASFVASGFFKFAFSHTLDGSEKLYRRLRGKMTRFFWTGVVTEVLGILCLFLKKKF